MATMAGTVMEEIAARCVAECVRQGVGVDAVGRLLVGYNFALERRQERPTESVIKELARIVEPSTNGEYRRVAVTFRDGGHATDWREVPEAVGRMVRALTDDADTLEAIRALLRVHPFVDGNGRLAFVLFNWLSGTLDAPRSLPDLDW